ncbi:MAG: rhomboid family intramembrane serine protease [Spirochaetota bacterium]|nr:rhomboid family intramembrane serine protease [Spirochaetota bacterium]
MMVQRSIGLPRLSLGAKWIIIVSAGIYVLQNLSQTLETNLSLWHVSSENFRPWQMISYMFVHAPIDRHPSVLHLIFNMIVVWMFGSAYENQYGLKRFLQVYFISGALTGLIYMSLFPNTVLMGASAGSYALLVAYAYHWPNTVFHLWGVVPVKAKYLVMALMVLGFFFTLSPRAGDMTAHLAHLIGSAIAFVFLQLVHKKYDLFGSGKPKVSRHYDDTPFNPPKEKREKIVYKDEWVKEKVDELLEKVSQKGIKSLTKKEKDFLDKVSMSYKSANDSKD